VVFVIKIETQDMTSVKYPAIIIVILLFAISCGEIEKLPPEPSIKFSNFEIFDSIDLLGNDVKGGRLNFYFEDGDGDLGLANPDNTLNPDSTNLFFKLYRKTGGKFAPAPENDPLTPSSYRIPFMIRLGQNKILKGNISVTFLYLFYSDADTIKYEFFVKDRAEHESNKASTCEIVVTKNGICNE
jgi:hypothetical protein